MGERQGEEGPSSVEGAVSEGEVCRHGEQSAASSASSANCPVAVEPMHVREYAEDEAVTGPGRVQEGGDGGHTGGTDLAAQEEFWGKVQAAVEDIENMVRGSVEHAMQAQAAAAQSEKMAAAISEGYLRAEQTARALEVLCGRLRVAVGGENDSSGRMLASTVPLSRSVGGVGGEEGGKCGGDEEGRDGSTPCSGPPNGGVGGGAGKVCSVCKEVQGPLAFSKKQWATRASRRKCFACTSGSGPSPSSPAPDEARSSADARDGALSFSGPVSTISQSAVSPEGRSNRSLAFFPFSVAVATQTATVEEGGAKIVEGHAGASGADESVSRSVQGGGEQTWTNGNADISIAETDGNQGMCSAEEIHKGGVTEGMTWPSQGASVVEAGLQGMEIDIPHHRIPARAQEQKRESDSLEAAMLMAKVEELMEGMERLVCGYGTGCRELSGCGTWCGQRDRSSGRMGVGISIAQVRKSWLCGGACGIKRWAVG